MINKKSNSKKGRKWRRPRWRKDPDEKHRKQQYKLKLNWCNSSVKLSPSYITKVTWAIAKIWLFTQFNWCSVRKAEREIFESRKTLRSARCWPQTIIEGKYDDEDYKGETADWWRESMWIMENEQERKGKECGKQEHVIDEDWEEQNNEQNNI